MLLSAVTRGWNRYRNKNQHRKMTMEKKIIPPLLQGFEPATFQSRLTQESRRCSAIELSRCPEWRKHKERRPAHLKKLKRDHVTPLLKELHWLLVKLIQHSVQARNGRFPSLRRHSSAIAVFFSLHISTIALPSFFDRTTAQNSKDKLENLRWTFFWLHCSDCLEFAAGRPERFSLLPNFES